MYLCFVDESGTRGGSPVFVVGGIIVTNRARGISNSGLARSIDIASVRRAPHRIGFGTGCSEGTSDGHSEL